jgi:hypothetical protein
MRKVVDLFKKSAKDQLVWTYVINLGQDGSHPSILDFKQEALRLAALDHLGNEQTLLVKIRGYE